MRTNVLTSAVILSLIMLVVYLTIALCIMKPTKPVVPASTADCSYQNKGLVIVCYVSHDSKTYVLVEARK